MVETFQGWQLSVFSPWQPIFSSITDVRAMLNHPEKMIQENSRGIVLMLHQNQTTFIAKRSLTQENRRWAQLTSCYRKGEGARTLRNMAALFHLGLPVPEPVLLLEKKRCGFVVASWSVYRYIEGQPCTCALSVQVAAMLKRIHQAGWVHRDPHVWNFLQHENSIHIIDCARARPWRSRYAQMYDVVLLNNCCPGSFSEYGISENNRIYQLAKSQNNIIKLWRRIKRKIRSSYKKNSV